MPAGGRRRRSSRRSKAAASLPRSRSSAWSTRRGPCLLRCWPPAELAAAPPSVHHAPAGPDDTVEAARRAVSTPRARRRRSGSCSSGRAITSSSVGSSVTVGSTPAAVRSRSNISTVGEIRSASIRCTVDSPRLGRDPHHGPRAAMPRQVSSRRTSGLRGAHRWVVRTQVGPRTGVGPRARNGVGRCRGPSGR